MAGGWSTPSGIHLWTWDARPYPVFPAATRRVERRGQLGDRPLADGPARQRRRSMRWLSTILADSRRRPAYDVSRRSARGRTATSSTGRWRRAPMHRAAGARLCLRCVRAGRRVCAFAAWRRAGDRIDRGRSGSAGGSAAGAIDAHAGNRTAARSDDRIYRHRSRLSPRARPPRGGWSAARRSARMPTSPLSPTTRRPSAAPKSGCRICGPGARAQTSRCRRAGLRSALATLRA